MRGIWFLWFTLQCGNTSIKIMKRIETKISPGKKKSLTTKLSLKKHFECTFKKYYLIKWVFFIFFRRFCGLKWLNLIKLHQANAICCFWAWVNTFCSFNVHDFVKHWLFCHIYEKFYSIASTVTVFKIFSSNKGNRNACTFLV